MHGGEASTATRASILTGWRQQDGGGVIFWAAIIGNKLVGPFKVADGVKMTTKVYIDFLKEHLISWQKKKKLAFSKNMVFMHDNAPSHAAKLTTEHLNSVFAKKPSGAID